MDMNYSSYNVENKKREFSNLGNINVSSNGKENLIYVPSINLKVEPEITVFGSWKNSHTKLQEKNKRMLFPFEFIEFLKYTKSNYPEIYEKVTKRKDPLRGEWIDANFRQNRKTFEFQHNHVFDKNGNLIDYKSEKLDENTLMKDKLPGITIDCLLNSHTKQGFPSKISKFGKLNYWHPRENINPMFNACEGEVSLDCNWGNWFLSEKTPMKIGARGTYKSE